jgi:hypothetical protein
LPPNSEERRTVQENVNHLGQPNDGNGVVVQVTEETAFADVGTANDVTTIRINLAEHNARFAGATLDTQVARSLGHEMSHGIGQQRDGMPANFNKNSAQKCALTQQRPISYKDSVFAASWCLRRGVWT